MTSRIPSGIGQPLACAVRVSRASDSRRWAYSCTKSGLPSVLRCTDCTSSAVGCSCGTASMRRATSASVSPASGMRDAPGARSSSGTRRGQRVVLRQLVVPVGPHHHEPVLARAGGHEAQEQQRRRVGGVQVLEDHDEGAILRRSLEQAADGDEEIEPGGFRRSTLAR